MALKINTYHGSFNRSRRAGGLGGIKYFVVHYTGGIGSAKNNCIFFATANRNSSADFFIDKDGSIWEYNNILDGYYTWHCGDGRGKYGISNGNSVSVEVVSGGEAFTAAQVRALADLYAHVCSVLGRKLEVVRHYDASRKSCPAPYVSSSKWAALKSSIENGAARWVKDSKGWWYRNADGSWPRSKWRKIGGSWYYFDSGGYALCNKWQKIGGSWYWFKLTCAAAESEWVQLKGVWYWFDSSCAAACGGWRKIAGYWYLFDGNCHALTGWRKVGGCWYYLRTAKNTPAKGPQCAMLADGWWPIGGKTYGFDSQGRCTNP
ncbi:peptidoglycan recognition family protein [Adlercreutzia equolifaciens]|uniref:peptidoglycan recognition protein family protein n=1 Tax=Adlercreutzia equolifaciens TaxID=446660 RepID=UPI001CC62653|nr:peptidoglycan recognition family protein [Adlercreutzia equolifaciens]GJC75299.1 hypothetical protein Aeq9CBH6_06340 [Adlercreutzia equolifaciens]